MRQPRDDGLPTGTIIGGMDSRERWRLVLSAPLSGPENMALDEAILESVVAGDSLPTLRLYSWEPPCLSLGYAQPYADADLGRLRKLEWGLVRRPTGGRAILHTEELTYSVAVPERHPLMVGGVLPSYQRLSRGLLAALANLSLEPEVQPAAGDSEPDRSNPICFQVSSAYEITVGGRKLIGSAQVRRRGGVLQHGSLPLSGDIGRVCAGLHFADEAQRAVAAEALRQRATTVEACLGRRLDWETAARAFAVGFGREVSLVLEDRPVSSEELRRTAELNRERYANPDWTGRL